MFHFHILFQVNQALCSVGKDPSKYAITTVTVYLILQYITLLKYITRNELASLAHSFLAFTPA